MQSLVRSEEGWDVDPAKSFEHYPFIGEIESSRPAPNEDGSNNVLLPFCGCCVSLTVLDFLGGSQSRNPTPPTSRSNSRSDFDTLV